MSEGNLMIPTDYEEAHFFTLATEELRELLLFFVGDNKMLIEFLGMSPDEWIEQRAYELMDYKLAEYRREAAEEHYDMMKEERMLNEHFNP